MEEINCLNNFYQLNVPKSKYSLLNQIELTKLPYLLDDIFELGYNTWIKNNIKSEFANSNVNSNTNILTESKQSNGKGLMGENIVMDIIIDRFPNLQIVNTSKIPHSGDIQITLSSGNKIIFEVKNYNRTIEQEQIDKLKYDMKFNNILGAVFISLNSGIVGKKRFEIETFRFNAKNYFILFVPYSLHKMIPTKKNIINHNSLDDSILNLTIRIEFSLCVIENIIDKFNTSNNFEFDVNTTNIDLEYLIQNLNIIYDEFKTIKNSSIHLENNIKKSLDSHFTYIKEFEHSITNKIGELIKKKLIKNNKKKFVVEPYEFTNKLTNLTNLTNSTNSIELNYFGNMWNVLYQGQIFGLVVYVDNKYDLLLEYSDIKTNKQFFNFSDCIEWIDKLN